MDAFRPLLIAGLVVTEVAIWQWRMVIAHRGSRVNAMLLGIVGAVLQITAITQVVADVSDPAGIIAYAVGVGFGVLLGLVAGERLTPGMIGVTIVTKAPHLARSLWDQGWPVTAQSGRAEDGPSARWVGCPSGGHEPPRWISTRQSSSAHAVSGAVTTTGSRNARASRQALGPSLSGRDPEPRSLSSHEVGAEEVAGVGL